MNSNTVDAGNINHLGWSKSEDTLGMVSEPLTKEDALLVARDLLGWAKEQSFYLTTGERAWVVFTDQAHIDGYNNWPR